MSEIKQLPITKLREILMKLCILTGNDNCREELLRDMLEKPKPLL